MIRPININLNAAHPELPLVEATTFTGAPSSVFIRGVPKNCGNWSITAVNVAVTYPDNSTTTRAAVESAEGVWVATIPGTATSGRTAAGFRILADGIDENGAAVTGYVLGFADFSVLSFLPVPAPGETFFYLRYFDTMPTTAKKMDVTTIDGILKYYNGTAWLPFTDLTNYYTAEQVDEAIDKLRDKLDLDVYGYGNASVSFPDGYSITYTYTGDTYTAPTGGESIEFYGPISSTAVPGYNFWVPYEYKDTTDFDPQAQMAWCLLGGSTPTMLMFRTGASYSIANWNTEAPTLTLSNGEATGDAPTMARPLGATGDTLAKVSQLAGKANDDAVVKLTGDQTISGNKTFYGDVEIANGNDLEVLGGRVAVRSSGGSDVALFENDRLEYSTDGGMTWTSIMLDNIAPLASPAFTGTPTAPTPSSGDDSTKVATTAFVQGAVPYALVTKTITNGAVSLDDRAINAVAVSSSLASLTVNFPTATSGKARDFGLRLTVASGVTTAPELALPQGVTCENADGEAPEIGADGAATILYFTETASGVFLVKGEVVTAIS